MKVTLCEYPKLRTEKVMRQWTSFSAGSAMWVLTVSTRSGQTAKGSSTFKCHSLISQAVSARACAHMEHVFGT